MKHLSLILSCIIYVTTLVSCSGVKKIEKYPEIETYQTNQADKICKYNPYKLTDVLQLWNAIHADIYYVADPPDYWQTPEETFRLKIGDCEDFNLLFLSCLLDANYEAYLVLGSTDRGSIVNHAWVVVIIDGKEYYLDATHSAPNTLQTSDGIIFPDCREFARMGLNGYYKRMN